MDDNYILKLKPSKTELLWFATPRGFDKCLKATVMVDSVLIKPSKLAKALDVMFDEMLSLATHVSNIC